MSTFEYKCALREREIGSYKNDDGARCFLGHQNRVGQEAHALLFDLEK